MNCALCQPKNTSRQKWHQFRHQFILRYQLNSLCFIVLRIKTCHWQLFICAVFILQALIPVRIRCFSKSSFFSPTRTHVSKKPYFTMLLSWNVNFLSQREAIVFRLKFDVKKCFYNTLIATAILGILPAI